MNRVQLTVNDEPVDLDVPGDETLLSSLRERIGALGTKEGCLEGECGACTVLLDGKPIDSCIYATAACAGRTVTTVEGIGSGQNMSPLQRAFVQSGAIQCGFCTPGFVATLTALLAQNPDPDRTEIIQAISGNICRCTGYSQIVEAAVAAAQAGAGSPAGPGTRTDTDTRKGAA